MSVLAWELPRETSRQIGSKADAKPCRGTYASPPSKTTQWAALLTVELRATEIETLIRRGLLKWETRNDRNAIINALYAFFDHTLNPMP